MAGVVISEKPSFSMFSRLFGCLLFVMLVALVNGNKSIKGHVVKTVAWNKNINTFKDWTCSKPQPRVVHINDLDKYAAPNVIYIPSAVVIYECGKSAGCCQKTGTVCTSVESEEEEIFFVIQTHITGFDPVARTQKKNKKKTKIMLRNSTRCECVGKIEGRAKRSPFVTQLDGVTLF